MPLYLFLLRQMLPPLIRLVPPLYLLLPLNPTSLTSTPAVPLSLSLPWFFLLLWVPILMVILFDSLLLVLCPPLRISLMYCWIPVVPLTSSVIVISSGHTTPPTPLLLERLTVVLSVPLAVVKFVFGWLILRVFLASSAFVTAYMPSMFLLV